MAQSNVFNCTYPGTKLLNNFERTIPWTEPLSMGHVWKPDCMPDQPDQQKCKPKRKAVAIAAEKSVNLHR